MKKLASLIRLGFVGLTALGVCALVQHLTFRDSVDMLVVTFYATPWPVLSALFLLCAGYWMRRSRWLGLACAALTLATAAAWVSDSFRQATPLSTTGKTFRFAYWNVCRPSTSIKRVLEHVLEAKPDALGVGESLPKKGQRSPLWDQRLAPRKLLKLQRGMGLAAPEGRIIEEGSLNGRGSYSVCRFQQDGHEIHVLMVDLDSTLLQSRRPAFQKIYALLQKYAGHPLILAGDFNTPGNSCHFDPIRVTMKSAFASAGEGCADTWPFPLPVLSLDHVWLSEGLRAVRCTHDGAWVSDHRMVVVDIAVE